MRNILIALVVLAIAGGGAYVYLSKKEATLAVMPSAGKYAGKKVFYVDSYYDDYDWSQGITRGIKSVLDGTGAVLRIYRMDTKRHPDEAWKQKAAAEAKAEIEAFNPDVLLVSDDNAFKYVVMPFYRDSLLPVVFSGLNWDASAYGAPYKNTTGMIEVSLTNQIVDHLKEYARGGRIGYLSADTETEHKNLDYYDKLLNLKFEKAYFVKTMADWRSAFSRLQNEVDMVIFENNAGIADWDIPAATAFAEKNTKVPVGTTNPWIMNYALLGITKIPDEQGEWQAEAALRIFDGAKPSDIPLVRNKRGNLMVNLKIARKLSVLFAPSILKNASQVIQ